MANADRPRGFWPAYTLHGGPPHMRRVKKAASIIFRGDLVMPSTTLVGGFVVPIADGDTDRPCGVAAEFSTETGTAAIAKYINIYDDLENTVFIGQADETEIAGTSQTMLQYTAIVTAASTCDSNETSIMEIDSSTTAINNTIYVIDKVDRVDNAWGGYVDCYVKIQTDVGHIRAALTT